MLLPREDIEALDNQIKEAIQKDASADMIEVTLGRRTLYASRERRRVLGSIDRNVDGIWFYIGYNVDM
jgi:hypothetical protein